MICFPEGLKSEIPPVGLVYGNCEVSILQIHLGKPDGLIQEELTKLLKKQAIRQLEHPAEAVQHFPSSQKGRRAETSDKSQSPKPARKHRAFQDGGYPHGKGPVEAREFVLRNSEEGWGETVGVAPTQSLSPWTVFRTHRSCVIINQLDRWWQSLPA